MLDTDKPRLFGRYTLHRRIAVGGMAEVYQAALSAEPGFEKPVALKLIHSHLSSDPKFVEMLVGEARLAATLVHPNIVQTFDLGRADGSHFIVMELVEGYDLDSVLRAVDEPLPISVAAYVVAELARGLSHAHRRRDSTGKRLGIVHRDISPQNVLLSLAGEVKIADFGIAKSALRTSEPDAGVIKGKYFYMSPEQAWGDPLDFRTDIFSAGVVLWELLCGRMLHEARPLPELLAAVRTPNIPAPSSLRPDIPQAFDAIVARATALRPEDRYRDARALADSLLDALPRHGEDPATRLRKVLEGLTPPGPRPEQPPRPLPPTEAERSSRDATTPAASGLRFRLEDGEPTVAGWRSPARRSLAPWLAGAVATLGLLGLLTLWHLQ